MVSYVKCILVRHIFAAIQRGTPFVKTYQFITKKLIFLFVFCHRISLPLILATLPSVARFP